MSFQEDAQWWAGAIGAAVMAFAGVAGVPHPYDRFVTGFGAALLAFCMYKITPGGK